MFVKQIVIIVATVTLFLLSFKSFGQKLESKLNACMQSLYNLNFDRADSIISTLDSAELPSYHNFLKAHYIRWKHLPIHEQDESIIELYGNYLVDDYTKANSVFDSLITINNALLKAEYHYNNKSYYKAFSNGASVYKTISPKIEQPIEAIKTEWLLPVSLYHYYYSYYSETNKVLAGLIWFFKSGKKEKGIYGLKKLANSNSFAQTEAMIYLSQIYLRIENKPDSAFKYASRLIKKHPANLKFYEFYIESSLASNNSTDSLTYLVDKLLASKNTYFNKYGFCYKALINQETTESSIQQTIQSIDNLGGGDHLKSLLYKKAYSLTKKEDYKELLEESREYKYTLTLIN